MDSSTNSASETGKPEEPQGVTETLTSSRSHGQHGLLGRFLVGILGGCIGAAIVVAILLTTGIFSRFAQVVNRSTNVTVSGSNQPVQDVTISARQQSAETSEWHLKCCRQLCRCMSTTRTANRVLVRALFLIKMETSLRTITLLKITKRYQFL